MGHWKNRSIQTPQRILMDPCIKQASVLSKRFWIIPWPLAYDRLQLDCIRKNNQFLIHFWMKMKSFRDYLGLSNSCSYDVDDVIGRADRFGFQNFCSPAYDPTVRVQVTSKQDRHFIVLFWTVIFFNCLNVNMLFLFVCLSDCKYLLFPCVSDTLVEYFLSAQLIDWRKVELCHPLYDFRGKESKLFFAVGKVRKN